MGRGGEEEEEGPSSMDPRHTKDPHCDWESLKCLLCARRFKSVGQLLKHSEASTLHKTNLAMKNGEERGHLDRDTLSCLLCQRQFPAEDVLEKHVLQSKLHKRNMEESGKAEGRRKNVKSKSKDPDEELAGL